jgi:photosystem II stability/assembly factor-like uncharacterized protein/predicted esterase
MLRTTVALLVTVVFAACSSTPPVTPPDGGPPGDTPSPPDLPPVLDHAPDLGGGPDAGPDLTGTDLPTDGPGPDFDCSAPTGLLHDQTLQSGGETRYYMLYVPTTYSCTTVAPLLVDFHGTSGGDRPEESYATQDLIAIAEQRGFIAVRPRSRSSLEGGQQIFRWDQNTGDLAKNRTYAHDLVAALSSTYRIDPSRTYASGFSSGTNMTAQFLADDPQLFRGYGFVGGGIFPGEGPAEYHVDNASARVWATSGFRDYLYPALVDLLTYLDGNGFPAERIRVRYSDNGHELYGWHFVEMLDWLDAGMRPDPGTLTAGWTRETVPSDASLTELSRAQGGAVVASASKGTLLRRDATGSWTVRGTVTSGGRAPDLAGICMLPSGTGLAVGQQVAVATTDDGLTWNVTTPVPAFDNYGFDPAWMNAAACAGTGDVVTGGYWAAAHSTTSGSDWIKASIDAGGYNGQVAVLKVSDAGTYVALGYYDYIGRSVDGTTFDVVSPPTDLQWLMGAAPATGGQWWIVGEAGTILHSGDDGQSFTPQVSNTTEDLYAVAFVDAQTGMAVGAHGAALLTTDGGASWNNVSTGLDVFLGDALWMDATTVLVVGEAGTALTYQLPPG